MATLDFTLNGKSVSVEVQPNEFLAEVLRYRLGLTGTKVGCNEAECGICTVIVDGRPIDSCIYPALTRCKKTSLNSAQCSAAFARRA